MLAFRSFPRRTKQPLFTDAKKSGLWDVYCGEETYRKIQEFTGFNLGNWMKRNVTWEADFFSQNVLSFERA